MKVFRLSRLLFFVTAFSLTSLQLFSQIEFIENKGQWNSHVNFQSRGDNGVFFLEKKGFTVLQHNEKELTEMAEKLHNGKPLGNNAVVHSHAYTVSFLGANPSPQVVPDRPQEGVSNFFIGNDQSKWAAGCKTYLGVTYKNMYPGIDVRYYSDGGGRLKYDIIAHPGSDVSKIALKYDGVEKLDVKNKELAITTSLGESRELYPYSYQPSEKTRLEVNVSYKVKGNVVTFKISEYNPDKILVIDPTEVFFTYSGSKYDNWGFTATYGPDGSFFSGGIVFGGQTGGSYPITPGAVQANFGGGEFDMGIIKLSADGRQRIYTTYIGGGGKEQPHSLICDKAGNLVIAGRTTSGSSYPQTGGRIGPTGGWDICITKLSADGRRLIGSMIIGGSGNDGVNMEEESNAARGTFILKRNYGDDARSEVILDAAENIYVAGCTQSGDFPVLGGVQSIPGGDQDAVVIKLTPDANQRLWSTYLGGSLDDAAYVLTFGANGNLYVAGGTHSANLTGITAGVKQPAYAGGECDGFIIEMAPDGSHVVRGTYLGTNAADQIYGIQTDRHGFIYVMGTTEGSWPVVNAPYSNNNGKQFICKLQPDLSNFVYSTVFGSGSQYPNISPTAFLVDRCENVYVSGWGGKSNSGTGFKTGTTLGLPVTSNAIKGSTDQSGSDFYFFVLEHNALSQLYGSFFGENDPVADNPQTFGDHVDGGTSRFDGNGVIYQAICGNCFKKVPFPGTPGTVSPNNQAVTAAMCNLGMLKIQMNFAGISAGLQPSINGVAHDTMGCVPVTVLFTDTVGRGKSYQWDFGDGTSITTTTPSVSHTYNTVGRYLVRLISIDPNACNIQDTAYTTIKAGDNVASLDFSFRKLPPCTNLTEHFDNTSSATLSGFNSNSFIWNFGDGTIVGPTSAAFVEHTYLAPGNYPVKLTLDDSTFCNSPLDTTRTLHIASLVKAIITTPRLGCAPYYAVFKNDSQGGNTFQWDFGDGTTSNETDPPPHYYPNVGTYTIKLTAFDPETCNKQHDTTITISVQAKPTTGFSASPQPPVSNTPIQFTNSSIGAVDYTWDFGDAETSTEINPSHLYVVTDNYTVCLESVSEAGCRDTLCQPVNALIDPLLDVPTAFTPGLPGANSTIKVMGFGIRNMHWVIYNRWGQKVYESNSFKNSGWDGRYNGKLQPMDVYTYVLEVTFGDGKKVKKTGDITLLK